MGYQITLHYVAGCVDLLVEFRSEEDGVEVAGEAPEDDGGAEDPETKQDAARGPWTCSFVHCQRYRLARLDLHESGTIG